MDSGKPADAHLRPADMDWLLSAAEGAPAAPDSADLPPAGAVESARSHLVSCAACRGILEQHRKVAASLASLIAMRLTDVKPDFPADTVSLDIAGGVLSAGRAEQLAQHAAQKAALEIRSNRANSHPYYWAALTACGSN